MSGATRQPRQPQRSQRSDQSRAPVAAAPQTVHGISQERLTFLLGIRDRIANGFYNTDPVLDDLSHSFTKAVDALV